MADDGMTKRKRMGLKRPMRGILPYYYSCCLHVKMPKTK